VALAAINGRLTGSPYPSTALAKSAALLPGQTLAGTLLHVLGQVRMVAPPLLRGYYLVPLGAVMLVGSGAWLAASVARERRERLASGWTFYATAVVLALGAALTALSPGNLGRYYHNACALLAIAGVLGWIALVRGACARWPRTAPVLAAALAVAALVYEARAQWHWGRMYALSMRDIGEQQVPMARWIAANEPAGAVVMANDVGAIGYYTRRPIFDLVGLVTRDEVTAYIVGPGAVFERLERMRPEERPTCLAIYPEWLGLDPLLGEWLFAPAEIPTVSCSGTAPRRSTVRTGACSGAARGLPPRAPAASSTRWMSRTSPRRHPTAIARACSPRPRSPASARCSASSRQAGPPSQTAGARSRTASRSSSRCPMSPRRGSSRVCSARAGSSCAWTARRPGSS
jgi:hypothetical protein